MVEVIVSEIRGFATFSHSSPLRYLESPLPREQRECGKAKEWENP